MFGVEQLLSYSQYRPHEFVSFDDLHFLDSGLWEDHLFEVHRWHIQNAGRAAAVTIDARFVN